MCLLFLYTTPLTLCPCRPHPGEIPSSLPPAPKPTHRFAPSAVTLAASSRFPQTAGQRWLGHLPLQLLGRGVQGEPPERLLGQPGLPGAGRGRVRGAPPVRGHHVGHHRLLRRRSDHGLWPKGYFRKAVDGLESDVPWRTDTELGDRSGPKRMRDSHYSLWGNGKEPGGQWCRMRVARVGRDLKDPLRAHPMAVPSAPSTNRPAQKTCTNPS